MKMSVFTSENESVEVDKTLYRLPRAKQKELKKEINKITENIETSERMGGGRRDNGSEYRQGLRRWAEKVKLDIHVVEQRVKEAEKVVTKPELHQEFKQI